MDFAGGLRDEEAKSKNEIDENDSDGDDEASEMQMQAESDDDELTGLDGEDDDNFKTFLVGMRMTKRILWQKVTMFWMMKVLVQMILMKICLGKKMTLMKKRLGKTKLKIKLCPKLKLNKTKERINSLSFIQMTEVPCLLMPRSLLTFWMRMTTRRWVQVWPIKIRRVRNNSIGRTTEKPT